MINASYCDISEESSKGMYMTQSRSIRAFLKDVSVATLLECSYIVNMLLLQC